jgi:TPR repeat protein
MSIRTFICFAITLASFSIHAAPGDGSDIARNAAIEKERRLQIYREQAFQDAIKAEIVALQKAELNLIYSKDPWRNVSGLTNNTSSPSWVEFQGQSQEVVAGGVIFKGKFGPVLTVHTDPSYSEHLVTKISKQSSVSRSRNSNLSSSQEVRDIGYEIQKVYGNDIFYVANFPYPADARQGYEQMMAFPNGYFSHTNSIGQVLTIPSIDYGTPCTKTWSQAEISASKQKAESDKRAIKERLLKSNQDSAGRGEPLGLMRMGVRYRDGDGVETNLLKAKTYFQKAADAGLQEAADELSKLNQ